MSIESADAYNFVFSSTNFVADSEIALKLLSEFRDVCYHPTASNASLSDNQSQGFLFEITKPESVAGWSFSRLYIKSSFFWRLFDFYDISSVQLSEPKGKAYQSIDEESAKFIAWFNIKMKENGSHAEIKPDPKRADYSRGASYLQSGFLSRLLEPVSNRKRPRGITALGLLIFLTTGFSIAGIGFLTLVLLAEGTSNPDFIPIIYFCVVGLTGPAWGIGILRGKKWAWWLTIVLMAGGIGLNLVVLVVYGTILGLAGVFFGAALVGYFWKQSVRSFFAIKF